LNSGLPLLRFSPLLQRITLYYTFLSTFSFVFSVYYTLLHPSYHTLFYGFLQTTLIRYRLCIFFFLCYNKLEWFSSICERVPTQLDAITHCNLLKRRECSFFLLFNQLFNQTVTIIHWLVVFVSQTEENHSISPYFVNVWFWVF